MGRRTALSLFRLAVAFAITLPLVPQNSDGPYFSLTSSQSFAPGSKPFVQMSAYGVDALRFRVYRVNDPAQFMRQLGDAHQFGGSYRVPNGKLTLLEQLHRWKSDLRREIRRDLRAEFTESPSQHLSFLKPSVPNGSRAAYFAEAPVLNSRQLVLSFLQPVTQTANRWDMQQISIPVRDKGVFLVEAVSGNLRAYTILTVSDIALVTKVGREHILYFVANRITGEPVPNASVATFEREETGRTVTTDADGVADIPVGGGKGNDLRVVATSGADVAFSDIGSWALNQQNHTLTGLVYTDRPVYRPGDAVHFRGIVRFQRAVGYDIPANQFFRVQIQDRDGKALYQKELATNHTGILHDEFTLAKNAPLGYFLIQIQSGDSTVSANFNVQEYKKPEYEVHVTPADRRVLEGQSTSVTIDSRYYFGESVEGAKVRYSIYKSRYWFPFWYEDEEDAQEEPNDYGANEEERQIEGQLDSTGKLVVNLATDVTKDRTDTLYRVEAGVTDKAGREITGTGYVIATYGSFALNLEPQQWFYKPNDSAAFKIASRDYENKPVSTPVTLELHRFDVKGRLVGEALSRASASTDAEGNGMAGLKLPPEGGEYVVIASAPSAGRTVEARQYLWISGENPYWDESAETQSVQIVPDKKSYSPGDTAKILIVTGGNNTPVLVTVEGRDLHSHALIRSGAGTATFSTPIGKGNEPAIFVSAEFLKGGKLFQGTKRIKVPPEDHKVNVKLTAGKSQYQPGQQATYSIDVTSPDGKPGPQTDLSLGVVDEAIYAIEKDTTPDLLSAFYGRDYNSVQSLDSLSYYFTGEAGTRRIRLAALRMATELAQLKPEQLVRPQVRKYFPDTAFWAADITTDDAGHAQAQFALPDSVTTWRATARAASLDDRYGSTTLKTIVRKNLIVRLAVPRFLIQGDEVVISAIVHNYLQSDKQAQVNVKLTGLTLLNGAATQAVTVPQKGEVKVEWRVKAEQSLQATIEAEALTNEESDALQLDLPIHPPGVKVRDPRSGSIVNSGKASLTLNYPADSVPGSRSLEIRLTPSLAGSIFSALEYLTSYPYGCVEQTMSSFLPDIVVTQAMRDLKLRQPIDQAQLDQQIQAGLDRLRGFHHEDGGWGWWATDDSHPFMTAYVVAGLVQARNAGVAVDAAEIASGVKWLAQYLSSHKNLTPDLVSYMLFAESVASEPDKAALESLYSARSTLSPYGLAFLGLSFEAVRDPRASSIAAELARSVHQNSSEAYWPATRDELLDFTADATPEATALVTKLLSKEQPTSPLLPKAALWLVNHRNEGYWWDSTKQTATVIYGLIDYVKASRELNPDLKATVLVNGHAAGSASFQNSDLVSVSTVTLDESKLNPASNQVEIQSTGTGRLYYSVSADHYSQQPKVLNEGAISLNVLRAYYRLVPSATAPIVYDLQPLNGPVAPRDVIAVRLTVTGSDWRYLMVEDPIPAGAEFVKDDNLFHFRFKPDWWGYWFTERENHDDRIAIFQEHFSQGQVQYVYLLKIVNPGLFHINPARVQPMYQPEFQATTDASTLEVKP